MKTICKHDYPSDLCGICNPPTKQTDDACRVSSVCRQLRVERDKAIEASRMKSDMIAILRCELEEAIEQRRITLDERNDARQVAKFWLESACGEFPDFGQLPWNNQNQTP